MEVLAMKKHEMERAMAIAIVAFVVAAISLAIDVYQLVVAVRGMG